MTSNQLEAIAVTIILVSRKVLSHFKYHPIKQLLSKSLTEEKTKKRIPQ